MTEKIGKIEKTFLGYEDHGIFTAYLEINYGGSIQGVGGYRLDEYDKISGGTHGTAEGLEFITHVIKVVLFEDDSWNAIPVGIKNLPTEKGETFIFGDLWS